MSQIIVDAALSSKLGQQFQPVDLCDLSGRVLGQFIPKVDISEWEPISSEISEEELDQCEKSTEWYSTEEVLAYLKSL
ncbi:MAG TPA: hypothetical protein VH682_20890 [Gemmataceae bacterium]|jgi:hypothetical protein